MRRCLQKMCRSLQNVKSNQFNTKCLSKAFSIIFKKAEKMKNLILSALLLALVTVSCNQKTKESTTDHSNMMSNDSTMMDKNDAMMNNNTTMMNNDTTMMNNKTKMMNNHTKIYACPMHPEVQGKLNVKCPECRMKLTEPVTENTAK